MDLSSRHTPEVSVLNSKIIEDIFLDPRNGFNSFPHRFAYSGHNRPQEDGMYRAPKKIAEVMGHEYETHLLSYARFDSKDLAKSFDQVLT